MDEAHFSDFGEEAHFWRRARVCSLLYLVFGFLSLTSDLACLGFCSLGYSAETEYIVLVELLLKESVARFFPSLGFPRIKILVSLVHGVDVILF